MSINFRGERFAGYNKPKMTPGHPTKKAAVLAKEGDKIKLVRFGAKGYADYTKHKDEKRRDSYKPETGKLQPFRAEMKGE